MSYRHLNSRRASFLLEALIAVSILSISLVVVLRSHITALRAQSLAQQYTLASLALEREMLAIIANGYLDRDLRQDKKLSPPFHVFEAQLTTKSAGQTYIFDSLNEATVTLSWAEGKKTHQISASTYVFNNP